MKRLLPCLAVLLLVGSFAAFAAPGTEAAGTQPAGPLTIEVTKAYYFDGGDVTQFPEDKQAYMDWFKERFGVTLKVNAFPRPEYMEKFVLAMTSGQVKGIAYIFGGSYMLDYFNDGATEALNDYLKDNKVWNSMPKDMRETNVRDGKLIALPMSWTLGDWYARTVRTDWLAKLGMQKPQTVEEFYEVIKAFTTKDPDGNGKADTYGLALTKGLWGGFASVGAFFNAYHAYPGIWIKDAKGKLVFGTVQPEVKAALSELQRLYAGDMIDREFTVKDGTKVSEDVAAGRIGVQYGAWWNCFWPLNFSRDKDPTAEWVAFQPLSVDAKPGRAQYSGTVGSFVVVSRKFSNPEATIKMLNLWFDVILNNPTLEKAAKYIFNPEDPEVVYYKYIFLGGDFAWPPQGNVDRTIQINNALKTGKTEGMSLEALMTLQDMVKLNQGDRSGGVWGNWGAYGPRGSMWAMQAIGKDAGLPDEFYGVPTPAMAEKSPALDKMRDEVFTRIILGAPVDATFDAFVADWKKLGGDDITREVNAWYAKQK